MRGAVRLVDRLEHPRPRRKRRVAFGLPGIPLHRRAHRDHVGIRRRVRLVRLALRLAPHAIVRASKIAEIPVTRAIHEVCRLEPGRDALTRIDGTDRENAPHFVCLHSVHMLVEEEPDVLLRLDDGELLLVLVVRGTFGVSAARRTELRENIAEPRVRRQVLVRAKMDAHFA